MRRRDDVHRAYWHLAAERQRIFEQRVEGLPGPWTDDEILARYRFTNPWRASDRVSQFLIRDVIYSNLDLSPEDEVVRIVLFRLFSRPATWQVLEDQLGPIQRSTLRSRRLPALLEELRQTGPIYTSAFILCANNAYGHDRKHLNHLALVSDMVRGGRLPRALAKARSLRSVYDALAKFPLIGPFMAYQLAIDLNYSTLIDFSENEFTAPGPGAERGIRKVYPDSTRAEMPQIIHRMVEEQDEQCVALGYPPPRLSDRRPLHAIDCQNLFCELDKYAREKFPTIRSDRVRIKAKFVQSPEPLPRPFYPPKWRLKASLRNAVVATE
jgi:alpha-glutamyl/putrescinyl thymine pyrophosphorylase clade 1